MLILSGTLIRFAAFKASQHPSHQSFRRRRADKMLAKLATIALLLPHVFCDPHDCDLDAFPPVIKLTHYRTHRDLDASNGTDVRTSVGNLSAYRDNFNVFVYGTPLGRICNAFVRQLAGVDELEFQDVGPLTVQPYAFRAIDDLRTVTIYYSAIANVSSRAFSNSSIVTLRIESNRIEWLAGDAFDDMPYLEAVNLNENNLLRVDARWFRDCPRLSLVDLSSNGIARLTRGAFRNLESARTCRVGENKIDCPQIVLAANAIETIDEGAFDGLEFVGHLVLEGNRIKHLPNVFDNSSVNYLNLKANLIECLDDDVLFSFVDMGAVYLQANRIEARCARVIGEFNDKHDVSIFL